MLSVLVIVSGILLGREGESQSQRGSASGSRAVDFQVQESEDVLQDVQYSSFSGFLKSSVGACECFERILLSKRVADKTIYSPVNQMFIWFIAGDFIMVNARIRKTYRRTSVLGIPQTHSDAHGSSVFTSCLLAV